jgi:hypothetical protein
MVLKARDRNQETVKLESRCARFFNNISEIANKDPELYPVLEEAYR